MIKLRFFFLQALFFTTPLVYAWLYIPGIEYTLGDLMSRFFPELHWSGFESVKVSFVLLISSLIIALTFIRTVYSDKKISASFLVSSLIFGICIVTSFVLNKNTNPYFFLGNPEKTHGLFLYIALFSIFWILRALSQTEKKRLFSVTFLGFLGVTVYALFQKYGLDPLRQTYNTRLDLWRIFSTLGNPNYLAGYVLLVLPLLRVYRFPNELSWQEHLWEICIWILSGILIYWTGSYLAWILFVGYVGYVIIDHVLPKK